jgi:DNA-binding SARP family transcriptional activator
LVRNGEVIPERTIGSKKGRTLLKLLALNAGTGVTIDEIVEVLWGDAPPARPEDNVATLVSRLRGVLGAAAIDGGRRAYSVVPGPFMEIDVYEAARLTTEAEGRLRSSEPTLASVAAERATQLLHGQLLEDEPDATWTDDARQAAGRLLRRARRCLWLSALELGEYRLALETAGATVRADELDEEAHRAVMLAHYRAGGQGAAVAAFERARQILSEELGVDPSPETQALHLAILRNEEPPPPHDSLSGTVASVMEPGFVGRDEELDALSERWEQVSAGSAASVFIAGEAGIGKSRLAVEAARMAESTGGLVLQSRCYWAESSLFLQPLAEAIRSAVISLHPDETREAAGDWAGTLGELVPEVTQVLRPIDYEIGPPQIERRRAFEAVASFFQKLSRKRPVLLLIDDLHLAGAETIEVLHFMLRRLSSVRLLIIGTVRSEETHDFLENLMGMGDKLLLGPLRKDAVISLARQAEAAELVDELMRKTRGHTLFVVEALRMVGTDRDAGSILIPDSLRNAVVARTKRLGTQTESFLHAVAVLGSTFDIEVAAQLAGVTLQDALRHSEIALEARLLVQSEINFEFANDLTREILYDTTPKPSRVALHGHAADLIQGNPEAVAIHRAAAGDWHAAANAWLQAGELAAGSFATRDAARLLEEAVAAASSSGDQLLLARSYLARSRALESLAEYREAWADASRALAITKEHGDSNLEAEALERLAWIAYSSRYDGDAGEFAQRASELTERAAQALGALPSAIVLTARVMHSEGDLKGALSVLDQLSSEDLDEVTEAAALSSLGCVLEHGDRFDEAARTLERAIDLCRKTKSLRPLISGLFFQGMAYGNLGRFARALSTFDSLAKLVEESGSRKYRARVANSRSWIYRELGEIERARDFAQEAIDQAVELGEIEPRAHAALASAECSLLLGDDAEAERMLEEADSMLRGRDVGFSWRLELRHVELAARLDPGRAEALLELARKYGSSKYEALAFGHLGRTGDALRIAGPLGSDYLTALVGDVAVAKEAIDRLTLALPEDLRKSFVARGRLSLSVASARTQGRDGRGPRRRRA